MFVCHSLSRISEKVMNRFRWNFVLWLGLPVGRTDWLWVAASVPDTDSRSVFHFFTIAEQGILGVLLAFLIQLPPDFYATWRNDWRRKDNKSTTLWHAGVAAIMRVWANGSHRDHYINIHDVCDRSKVIFGPAARQDMRPSLQDFVYLLGYFALDIWPFVFST